MAPAVVMKGRRQVDRKTVSISSKRQITIPLKFFESLGFGEEAECIVRDGELVIRPIRATSGGEFAEQILAELIADGLSGAELLSAFKKKQSMIRPAVEAMIADAELVAIGAGVYESYDDVFGSEEEE